MPTPTTHRVLLHGACALFVLLGLACGGGDEDESATGPTGTAPGAAPAPTGASDPLQAHAAVIEQLRTQLEELARSRSSAFRNPFNASQSLNPNNVGRDLRYSDIRLGFRGGPGTNGPNVVVFLSRLPDGRVVVRSLNARASTAGAAALVAPPPLTALSQAVRLAIMDRDCEALPIATPADRANGTFDEMNMNDAGAVRGTCVEARAAFNQAPLALTHARVSAVYRERPGSGVITSLTAKITGGQRLSFREPSFTLAR